MGVLALQGGYAAHCAALGRLGHAAVEVRTPDALDGVDGLVLPGGESTTHLKLIRRGGLEAPLKKRVEGGAPVLATCAGLILSAARVLEPEQESFGWIDVTVRRNGWGRQIYSREAISDGGAPMVLIRAPRIEKMGDAVTVVDTLAGEPVLVRQGNLTAATYHPELTESLDVHRAVFGE